MKTILTSIVLVFTMLTSYAQPGDLIITNTTNHNITIQSVSVINCTIGPGPGTGLAVPVNVTIGPGQNTIIGPVSSSPTADWAEINGFHTDLIFSFEAPFSNCLQGTTESGYLNINWGEFFNTFIAQITL